MKKDKIKWRLGKLPTPEQVSELVKADLITKEEAREILFNVETEETIEVEALKSEIKFLREIVDKLAEKSKISDTIKVVEHHYQTYPWYNQYYYWSTPAIAVNQTSFGTGTITTPGTGIISQTTTDLNAQLNCSATGSTNLGDYQNSQQISFTDIQTF